MTKSTLQSLVFSILFLSLSGFNQANALSLMEWEDCARPYSDEVKACITRGAYTADACNAWGRDATLAKCGQKPSGAAQGK